MNTTNAEIDHDVPTNLNVDSVFFDGFDVIMELTKEEKKELIKMWRDYYDKTV